MNANELNVLEELITGLLVCTTIVFVAYSPLFRALGNRIMHGKTLAPGTPPAVDAEREAQLSGTVAALRAEIDGTHERLAFNEPKPAQTMERGAHTRPQDRPQIDLLPTS